jgi:hypothetical protein
VGSDALESMKNHEVKFRKLMAEYLIEDSTGYTEVGGGMKLDGEAHLWCLICVSDTNHVRFTIGNGLVRCWLPKAMVG